MANTQDILLTYRTDTGEVTKSFDEIAAGLSEIDKKLEDSTKKNKEVKDGLKQTGKAGKLGFNAIGTAIKATGIGLLVAVVAKLIEKFTENKKVAEALEIVFAGIGVVLNQIVEAVIPLGEAIINAFTNPQEAIDGLKQRLTDVGEYLKTLGRTIIGGFQLKVLDLKESFIEGAIAAKEFLGRDASELKESLADVQEEQKKIRESQEENKEALAKPFKEAIEAVTEFGTKFVEKTKKAVEQSNTLTRAQQRLREAILALNVAEAQTAAQINELKEARDSERNSIDERIELAKEAAELEQGIADQRLAIANKTVSQLQEEIRLQGASLEREEQLADARVEAAAAAEAAGNIQVELLEFIIGLQQIRIDLEDELYNEAIKREAELAALNARTREDMAVADQAARDAEEIALLQQYDQRIAIAGDDEGLIKAATEALNADLDALNKKYADKERKRKQDNFQADLQMASNAMGALMALNLAFAGESEAEQKRAFERNKKFQVGQAIIQTAMAVTGALTAGGNPIKLATGAQFVEAAIAAATGVAQIATIKKTKFGSGSTPPPPGSNGGGGATGAIPQSPQLDLGFLGAGAGQTGFRTYVVSSEVSNAQQANQRINDQASLVG